MMPHPVTSLYAHIPFCPKKCPYCAFVTHVGSLKLVEPYLDALRQEVGMRKAERAGGPLETVYFGGGTPSLLSPHQIGGLLQSFDSAFGLSSECEVTMEAHPETVDAARLHAFRDAGVTRISFGGESLNQAELRDLERRHGGERVLEVAELSAQAGFESINVDLMYGIPGQTLSSWENSLRTILNVHPQHLSLYPLSIEPGTVFARRWKQNTLSVPEDEAVAEMYHLACRLLSAAGFDHYEVANWALPGHRCRHNLAYWRNREFYALGVGAHGYLRPHRTENVTQTRRYIEQVLNGSSPVQARTHIDRSLEMRETLMLRLRLLGEGVDLEEMRDRFELDVARAYAADIDELATLGLVRREAGRLVLTETAVPVANEVWSRFI